MSTSENLLDLFESLVFRVGPDGVPVPLNKRAEAWAAGRAPSPALFTQLLGGATPDEVRALAAAGQHALITLDAGTPRERRVRWDLVAHGDAVLAVGIDWIPAHEMVDRLTKDTLLYKELVLNLMPRFIVDELVERKAVQPKAYRESTIFFINAVAFAHQSRQLDPVALVKKLDHYFSLFDRVTSSWGVEKIKTMGDAYMAASGIPHRRTSHAVDAALACLEIQNALALEAHSADDAWSFRMGVHSGPCISGVLGSSKHQFDIWGDTVTVAQRVEGACAPGEIWVSRATFTLLEPYFMGEPASTVAVPTVGDVEVVRVQRLRPEYAADAKGQLPNDDFRARYRTDFRPPAPSIPPPPA